MYFNEVSTPLAAQMMRIAANNHLSPPCLGQHCRPIYRTTAACKHTRSYYAIFQAKKYFFFLNYIPQRTNAKSKYNYILNIPLPCVKELYVIRIFTILGRV